MTPLDLPLYNLQSDEGPRTASTESIEKIVESGDSAVGQRVTLTVTAARLGDLSASRPQELLLARLLKERPQLAELRVLLAVTGPRVAALTLTGRPAGARPLAICLQLAAGAQQPVITEGDCQCEHGITCTQHSQHFRAVAEAGQLQVCVDRVHHRPSGVVLRRLLASCPHLQLLHVRTGSWRDLRVWQEGGALPGVRHLAITSRSACGDIQALSQLFPELRQLSLSREADERREERCTCRFRATTLLPRLESVRLENVCATATAAIRAYAKSLHTLQLKSCSLTSPSSEYLNRASEYQTARAASLGGSRTFRDIIQAILRRKLITLPNIQIRRLQVTDNVVDVALLNRNFPCLKALEVECHELTAEAETKPVAGPALWFPCLERLQLRFSGSDTAEPCILQRPLPRLTHYEQSFGSVRLSQLAVCCPRLQVLRLDPVLLEQTDSTGQLPQLQQLTVSWCGSDTLEMMVTGMPALQRVSVLDPPFLDKRCWMEVTERLSERQIQVALEW